jgi:hypothetical protein
MNANIFCSICHRIPSECGGVHELNAYEIADRFEKYPAIYSDFGAAKLLRQQADRIAHLEMLLANRNEIIDKLDLNTPQIKELSDDEIIEIRQNTKASSTNNWADSLAFAKAILKKASEK